MNPRTLYLIKRAEIEVTSRVGKALEKYNITPAQFTLLYFVNLSVRTNNVPRIRIFWADNFFHFQKSLKEGPVIASVHYKFDPESKIAHGSATDPANIDSPPDQP